jgi:hypothetical protein
MSKEDNIPRSTAPIRSDSLTENIKKNKLSNVVPASTEKDYWESFNSLMKVKS